MSINNLTHIIKLLQFDSEDDFYHLQIIKRKKEHPELGSNSMIVKTYYIKSVEHLEKVMPEIVCLCNFHNARGSINLNRRSFEKIAFHLLQKVTNQVCNKDFQSCKDAYNSVCGAHSNEPKKRWIIDLDEKDHIKTQILSNTIKNCEPNRRSDKVIAVLETKNGFHLITHPFNIQEFSQFHADIDIHKDNPTILYIP